MYLIQGSRVGGVRFSVILWRALWKLWHLSQDLPSEKYANRKMSTIILYAFQSVGDDPNLTKRHQISLQSVFRSVSLYLEHFLWLLPLTGVNDPGLAVPFRISDQRGNLAHFLLLKDVGLWPAPRHNGLGNKGPAWRSHRAAFILGVFGVSGVSPHLPKVEDEAVAFVDAAPGQCHLLGTNVALPFDLIQPVHSPRGLRPPESRLHTALLWETLSTSLKTFQAFFLCSLSCLCNK